MKKLIAFTTILLFLLLISCQNGTALPTVAPTAVPITSNQDQPTPTTQPLPTQLPTATTQSAIAQPAVANLQHPPTITPAPVPLIVAVVPEWETAVSTAISQLNQENGTTWQILVSDNPTAELDNNSAQIALGSSASGTLLHQEPIVLAVPFTTEWEATTLAEAEQIIADGHAVVTVTQWHTMPPMSKTLRIDGYAPDDPAYPLQKRLTLTAVPNTDTAVAQLTTTLQSQLQPKPVFRLAAVGDIMLARRLGQAITNGKLDYPFANVSQHFHAADLVVGNMESALGTLGTPAPKSYPFQAPPQAAQAIAQAGIDIVSLANNHAMDYGPEALLDAINLLHNANVAPIGAGENFDAAHAPYITEVNGLTIAFFGYVNVPIEASSAFDTETWTATNTDPGLAWANPEEIMADVTAVRDQVDLVAVVLHSGFEYIEEPGEAQMAAAHAAIDAGADIVIGHHAHILQGIEYYKDGVIVYGLGNFAFDIDGDPNTAILNVWLDANGVRSLELIPAIIQEAGQPRIAEEWEAKPILQKVYFLTMLLN